MKLERKERHVIEDSSLYAKDVILQKRQAEKAASQNPLTSAEDDSSNLWFSSEPKDDVNLPNACSGDDQDLPDDLFNLPYSCKKTKGGMKTSQNSLQVFSHTLGRVPSERMTKLHPQMTIHSIQVAGRKNSV